MNVHLLRRDQAPASLIHSSTPRHSVDTTSQWQIPAIHSSPHSKLQDAHGRRSPETQLEDLSSELLSLSFDLANIDQPAAAILFLVSKRFNKASKDMACWEQLQWKHAAQCATDKTNGHTRFASLLKTIQNWLGNKVLHFDGTGCAITAQLLTDDVISTVLNATPNLKTLKFHGCPRITDSALNKIARATPKLQNFSMQWCGSNIYYGAIIELVKGNKNLRSFAISCDMESRSLSWKRQGSALGGDDLAAELVENCKYIQELELSDTTIGDSGLSTIAKGYSHHLHTLTLNYCTKFTTWGMQALATCHKLSFFSASCSSITNQGLVMLAMGCPILEQVHIDRCKGVDLAGVMRAMEASKSIKVLSLTGLWRSGGGGGGRVDDEERVSFLNWIERKKEEWGMEFVVCKGKATLKRSILPVEDEEEKEG